MRKHSGDYVMEEFGPNGILQKKVDVHLEIQASNFHLSHVTMAVIASIAALLLILTAFLGVKHFNKKPRTMTVNEGQTENAIVYSNVREKMISIYMIITALVPTALAKGTTTTTILNTAEKKVEILHEEYKNKSYFNNGIFKLNKAQKRDSGDYLLETHSSDGTLVHKINIHLKIQAPVSKPAVSQTCLSPEQMKVSCSSEGDEVEFILTLDSQLVTQIRDCSQTPSSWTTDTPPLAGSGDKQHKPCVSSVAISLHGQLTGNFIICNVRNNASREESVIHLKSCKGSVLQEMFAPLTSALVIVAVIASVVTLLLVLALFLGVKHLNKKTRPTTTHEDNAEDEIVYSDVRVMNHTKNTGSNSHQNKMISIYMIITALVPTALAKAPVSKPTVSQTCLSPEQMKVSCSSEGDEVEFILSLDSQLVTQIRDRSQTPSSWTADTPPLAGSGDKQHKPGVSSVATISLHGQLTGNFICNVRNNASREESAIHLKSCKGTPVSKPSCVSDVFVTRTDEVCISHFSLVIVAVIASVVTLLLVLALFLGVKHLNKKTRPTTTHEDNAEDEIVYSDVRVMNHTKNTGSNSHQNVQTTKKTMTAMYMIFATLATAALAKGPIECNFCEHTKAWCSGAVGQLLLFHLPSTANTEIKLIKDDKHMILKIVKNQKITLHEEYVNQSQLLRNGTFILGNAMRKHSGEYVMEEFGPNGILQKKVDVHLEIQALVSKPAVSQMCLSAEQMKVSCSSEGDGVEFILTLDGIFLMQMNQLADSQSLTGNAAKQAISSGVSVNLYDQLTGNLMCQVRNNVSRDETSLQLGGCKGTVFQENTTAF
ncbi:hypothetical protein L3Q82_022439, partial [Scortum barcoo]